MLGKMLLFTLISSSVLSAQESVTATDSAIISASMLSNINAIATFYDVLKQPQPFTNQKINVVHIGDSHIQADLLTNAARVELQKVFGNGGRGFVFPYNLAKTNGASDVRFSSNAKWESQRNIHPKSDVEIGLSGIGLESVSDNLNLNVTVRNPIYFFNTVKIFSPEHLNNWAVGGNKKVITSEVAVAKTVVHRIKNGESLSTIATKYKTTITAIKSLNSLKSNTIRAGKSLKIPSNATQNTVKQTISYEPIAMQKSALFSSYKSELPQSEITLLSEQSKKTNVTGLVLENSSNGLIYHNIGVNGAKFSDYNKYPLFFEQISALKPDLVILSLGTNESFDKMESADYIAQLKKFLENLRQHNPKINILVVTPPPSLFNRRNENRFVQNYADAIIELSSVSNFAVWDLYSLLGGHIGVSSQISKGNLGADRVHYTKQGYEMQGKLLAEAIINGLYLKQ